MTAIRMAKDFYKLCSDLKDRNQEQIDVILLNQKNVIIGREMVFLGMVASCNFNPREILRVAIASDAAAICVVHNHPSGDTKPSDEDHAMFNRMEEACKIIGIRLLDNIIIGDGYYATSES